VFLNYPKTRSVDFFFAQVGYRESSAKWAGERGCQIITKWGLAPGISTKTAEIRTTGGRLSPFCHKQDGSHRRNENLADKLASQKLQLRRSHFCPNIPPVSYLNLEL